VGVEVLVGVCVLVAVGVGVGVNVLVGGGTVGSCVTVCTGRSVSVGTGVHVGGGAAGGVEVFEGVFVAGGPNKKTSPTSAFDSVVQKIRNNRTAN